MTGGGRWVQLAVRLAQQVMCTLYVALALVGVLFTPPTVLLTVGPAVGLVAAGLLVGLLRSCLQRPPGRRTVVLTAVVAAALVPVNEAVQLLQGLGTGIALTVLVLGTVVGNHRLDRALRSTPTDGSRTGGSSSYADLLSVMPLETVCSEWRALEGGVGLPPGERRAPELAQVRTLLLDEMHRRDPVGFGRWLDDGALADPERYVRGDHGLAA